MSKTKNTNWFVRNLLKVDFYGEPFNLKFGENDKYKSIAGAIISLLLIGFFLYAVILFGNDFVNRSTYSVSSDTGFYAEDNKPLLLPENMEDTFLVFSVDKKIGSSLIVSSINPKTKELYKVEKCSEEQEEKANTIKTNLNYCLRIDQQKIGFEKTLIETDDPLEKPIYSISEHRISLTVSFCDASLDSNCKFDKSASFYGIVSFPQFSFISKEYGKSANQVTFKNQNYLFQPDKIVYSTSDFDYYLVDDDAGWLIKSIKKYRMPSFVESKIVNLTLPNNKKLDLTLRMTNSYKHYYRNYQKLAEVSALIGGLVKVVTSVLSFTRIYQNMSIDNDLINFSYRKDDSQPGVDSPSKTIRDNFLKNSSEKDKSALPMNNNKKLQTVLSQASPTKIMRPMPQHNVSTTNSIIKMKIVSALCCCQRRTSEQMRLLQSVYDLTNKDRDFLSILTRMREFDCVARLVLNKMQLMMLTLQDKPRAFVGNAIESDRDSLLEQVSMIRSMDLNEKKKQVEQYIICEFFSEKGLSETDKQLLNSLDSDLQEEIWKSIGKRQGV